MQRRVKEKEMVNDQRHRKVNSDGGKEKKVNTVD